MESVAGQLLVAGPALVDPNFARTVVLVAAHSEEGGMGVILNRPTHTRVGEALPDLDGLLEPDDVVHEGGPVATQGVVVLAEFDEPELAAARFAADLGFVGLDRDPAEVAAGVRRARAFAGHAGWGPGQLDTELEEEGGWIVAPFEREDAFGTGAAELWAAALRRLGGRFSLLARMPDDPSVN
jgi:putative transcriptional regulator